MRYRKTLVVFFAAMFFAANMPFANVDAVEVIEISTVEQLQRIGNEPEYPLDGHYLLVQDIDASSTENWNNGEGFYPIGGPSSYFSGIFDGDGHTIINLHINRDGDVLHRHGLFAELLGAEIRNLRLTGINIQAEGYTRTGALAGSARDSVCQGIEVNGNVNGGIYHTGGLIGYSRDCLIENAFMSGYVSSENSFVGGIAGYVTGGNLHMVFFSGTVMGDSNTGGLVGEIYCAGLRRSYALGTVEGTINVGGLVGELGHSICSLIADCYSRASVDGVDGVGGLVGLIGEGAAVYRTYSSGLVTGTGQTVGGLLGQNNGGKVNFSYWDIQTSGQSMSAAGLGFATHEMKQQASYEGFNFENLWSIDEGNDYPLFQNVGIYIPLSEVDLADLEGSGNEDDPYRIGTASELNAIRQGLNNHYCLTADIDLSDSLFWDAGQGWLPIGIYLTLPFSGSFDGNGHTIENLNISRDGTNYQGLFGYLDGAEIRNLRLVGGSLRGGHYSGILGGKAINCVFDNIAINGRVDADYDYVGGLAGYARGVFYRISMDGTVCGGSNTGGLIGKLSGYSELRHGHALGKIEGEENVGGLIGHAYGNCDIMDSYSRAAVGAADSVGGLIGWLENGAVLRSYSTGMVTGTGDNIGGLLGQGDAESIRQGYWDISNSGQLESASGIGLSANEMKRQSTYLGFNFETLWSIEECNDYPVFQDKSNYLPLPVMDLSDLDGTGTEADPYLIGTAAELNTIRQGLDKHYLLTKDIDLSGSIIWDTGQGWLPVGSSTSPFSGSFDGGGHAVINMQICRNYTDYQGLFGYLNGSEVRGLNLKGVNLHGDRYNGTLAAYITNSLIEGILVDGNIRGEQYSGGLVGFAYNSQVRDSAVYGTVLSESSSIGGLAGYFGGGIIERSFMDGSVNGASKTGGIVGYLNTGAQLGLCYSQGFVNGTDEVGGLTGYMNYSSTLLEDSYSRAMIGGTNSVGGLVGFINSGSIYRVFSTGFVEGTGENIGGLIGNGAGGNIEESYWDMDSSMHTFSYGGLGKTNEEMTFPSEAATCFQGWDFQDVWGEDIGSFRNSGYPYLKDLKPSLRAILSPVRSGTIVEGDILHFNAKGSDIVEIDYNWDFGDGRVSDRRKPGLIDFPETGKYHVSLSLVLDGEQQQDSESREYTVVPDVEGISDLAVVDVGEIASDKFRIGQDEVLCYRVSVTNSDDLFGQCWKDSVYLSDDPNLSGDDILLGTKNVCSDIVVDNSYFEQIDIRIPMVEEGDYFFIVSIDDDWLVLDRRRMNNIMASDVMLYVPELEESTAIQVSCEAGDFSHCYKLNSVFGDNPEISITSEQMSSLSISAGLDKLPSWLDYEYRTREDTLLLPTEADSTWYLIVEGSFKSGAGDYTIRYDMVAMKLLGVSPKRAGIGGQLVLKLTGAGFVAPMIVELEDSQGEVFNADSVSLESYTEMSAEFYAGRLAEGTYSVRVKDAEGRISTNPDAINMIARIVSTGTLEENTVWSGLISIEGDVVVPDGLILEILPGSVLEFVAGSQLEICGEMEASGSASLPIRFISEKESENSSAPGDWTGLIVRESGKAVLNHFEIRNAITAVNGNYQEARIELGNGIIRDNSQYGIYVYAPYVDVKAENLLIANCGFAGVHAWADSRYVFRNCTIVDNGFSCSDRCGGIHHGAANTTLDNTIVAFNRGGLVFAGAEPEIVIRRSLFHNPGYQNIVPLHGIDDSILALNGNISSDPLFVNREAGNYELADFSPGIDAAGEAPITDILDRERIDDQGLENLGCGSPPYVDIGAFERQESTEPANDLSVIHVDAQPLDLDCADTISLTWIVENTGERDLVSETWIDAVYLSATPYLNTVQAILLGEISVVEDIAVKESYSQTLEVEIPEGVVGPRYVIVRSNSGRAFREISYDDNTFTMESVLAIAVQPMSTDTSQSGAVGEGEWVYYRLELEAGRSVRIVLDADGESGELNLLLHRGRIPTTTDYLVEATEFDSVDQQLAVMNPTGGVYYIGVYGKSLCQDTDFSLIMVETALSIRGVSPDSVGNAGTATVEILGDNFTPRSRVLLLVPGHEGGLVGKAWYEGGTAIYATFDLHGNGVPPGTYDLTVTDPEEGSVTLAGALTVSEGGSAELETSMTFPGSARPGRQVDVIVEYSNTGNIDLPARMITLEAGEGVAWHRHSLGLSPDSWKESASISFLSASASGPAGILRPGQSETLTVTARTPFSTGDMSIGLFLLEEYDDTGSDRINLYSPIDWAEMGEALWPVDMPDDAWHPLLARLRAQIGETWGDYVDAMNRNATQLSETGRRILDIEELFTFEFVQASTQGAPSMLEAARDAFAPAAGLSLNFERYFLPQPMSRARLGSLGCGWTHSYQLSLSERSDGSVAIRNSGTGFDRVFEPDDQGGYTGGPSERGTLEALPDDGFELTERNGLAIRFRSDGLWEIIEDSNGNRLTGTYDGQGRLHAVSHSNGDRLEFEYNAAGRLVRLEDHAGRSTTFAYDASNEHLLSATGPDGESTAYTYISDQGELRDHHLATVVRPGGIEIHFSYDELGRMSGHSLASGEDAVAYAYDDGGKTMVSDAFGNTSSFWTDSVGLNTMVEDPLGHRTRMSFDGQGNLTEFVDPATLTTLFFYDSESNMTGTRDPLGQETAYRYGGPFDNLTSVRDARGNAMRYSYDGKGNLTRIVYEDESFEEFQLDGIGNLTAWTNRRGDTVSYSYNFRGQKTEKSVPGENGPIIYEYSYDTVGNLLSATGPEGETRFTYENQTDRILRIDYPEIADKEIYLAFEYDAAGRRTRSTDQDGRVLNYVYNVAGRLEKVADGNSETIVEYGYDAKGRMVSKTVGNGVYTSYAYDAADRLIDLENRSPDDDIISHFRYAYDALGHRTSMTTHYGVWTYAYDDTGQLVSAVLESTAPDIPDQALEYKYDAVGNRTRTVINGVEEAYDTNQLNQYMQAGNTTYTYDVDGNLIGEEGPEGTTIYTYNVENRLIGIAKGGDEWRYFYDALGNRVAIDENGAVTHAIVDPIGLGNLVGEYDDSGNRLVSYDYGYGLVRQIQNSGSYSYYCFDALGNVSEMTSPGANVLNSYAYRPFGMKIRREISAQNPFEFVGEWGVMAGNSRLIVMGARFFDAKLGRFCSRDPIGIRGGDWNLYRYVENKPITKIDPMGLVMILGQFDSKELGIGENPEFIEIVAALAAIVNSYDFSADPEQNKEKIIDDLKPRLKKIQDLRETFDNIIEGAKDLFTGMDPFAFAKDKLFDFVKEKLSEKIKELFSKIWPFGIETNFYNINIRASQTPEDKFGTAGYDPDGTAFFDRDGYIRPGQWMSYRVDFWNDENAEVPTQDAVIKDALAPELFDLNTFEFTRIGFLDWDVSLSGRQVVAERIDTRPDRNFVVDVSASFDPETGEIEWWFHTVDPLTGDYPADDMVGFLPPVNPETMYELGWVEYRVRSRADLPSGTRIENRAIVQFDFVGPWGKAPPYGPWVNTIDATPPTSSVDSLPATIYSPKFAVSWAGEDDGNGSGVGGYDIYVREDGGIWKEWLQGTQMESGVFKGNYSRTYEFYSISIDNAGNREEKSVGAETSTIVGTPVMGDIDANGVLDLGDAVAGLQILTGVTPSGSVYISIDVNGDERIDMIEVKYVLDTVAQSR